MATEPTPTGGSVQPDPNGVPTINIPQDAVPTLLQNAPHPDQTRTYPVVVNGRAEQWTLEKLTTEAQTGAAGREAFQTAADQRKENARAIAVEEDLAQVFKDGDADAFRRLGATYGMDGTKVEELLKGGIESEEGEEEDEQVVATYLKEQADAIRSRKTDDVEVPINYSRFTPDVQRLLREGEKARIDKIVKIALDKDETIAYNMEAHTKEGRAAIREYVDEKIRGRLDSHAGDFGDGTRILAEVLPEIRTHLQALGIPGERTQTGLGHAPGGGDIEIHPTKLPEHVPSTEGDAFDQNVLETLAFHQSQIERGKQS